MFLFNKKNLFGSKRVPKSRSFSLKGIFSALKEFRKFVSFQWKKLFSSKKGPKIRCFSMKGTFQL
jgi:hypothetical protein